MCLHNNRLQSSGADGSELISDFIRSKDLDAKLPDRPSYHVELVEENERDIPQKILRVSAPPTERVGVYEKNKTTHFAIYPHVRSAVLKVLVSRLWSSSMLSQASSLDEM